MKPFLNLNDLEDFSDHKHGPFASKHAAVSKKIGAKKLGYNLTVLEPGFKVCPFHNHRVNEEMFLILEGNGVLRFGSEEYAIKAHDIIACPPGGEELAHQIINTGDSPMKYLSLATNEPVDVCEYPDSGKVLSMVESDGKRVLNQIARKSDAVDYFDGEDK